MCPVLGRGSFSVYVSVLAGLPHCERYKRDLAVKPGQLFNHWNVLVQCVRVRVRHRKHAVMTFDHTAVVEITVIKSSQRESVFPGLYSSHLQVGTNNLQSELQAD